MYYYSVPPAQTTKASPFSTTTQYESEMVQQQSDFPSSGRVDQPTSEETEDSQVGLSAGEANIMVMDPPTNGFGGRSASKLDEKSREKKPRRRQSKVKHQRNVYAPPADMAGGPPESAPTNDNDVEKASRVLIGGAPPPTVRLSRKQPQSLHENEHSLEYEKEGSNAEDDVFHDDIHETNAEPPDNLLDTSPLFPEDIENGRQKRQTLGAAYNLWMWGCLVMTCLVIALVTVLLVLLLKDSETSSSPTNSPTTSWGTLVPVTPSPTSTSAMNPPTSAPAITITTSTSTLAPTYKRPISMTDAPTTPSPSTAQQTTSPSDNMLTTIPTNQPNALQTTNSPTSSQSEIGRLTTLPPGAIVSLPDFTMDALGNRASPQAKAYEWLSEHPLLGEWDEWRKQQVFALATTYYSFHDGPSTTTKTTRSFFRREYLNYFVSECFWGGVGSACTDDRIHELRIQEGTIPNATIPPEVVLLPSLESISLIGNAMFNVSLSQLLPEQLESLTNLTKIHILWNPGLGGPVPPILWSLTDLVELYMESNDLQHTIPTEIGLMTNLEMLGLIDNPDLVGPIPSEIGQLTKLTSLNLHDNSLNGTIPSEFGKLTSLAKLELYGNSLMGPLPAAMCKFDNLTVVEIDCDFVLCPVGCGTSICQCHM